MVNLLSQFSELLWAAKKVEEEGGEYRLRGVGTRNNNKVAIVDNNLEWYFFFFRTKFVGLWKCSPPDMGSEKNRNLQDNRKDPYVLSLSPSLQWLVRNRLSSCCPNHLYSRESA